MRRFVSKCADAVTRRAIRKLLRKDAQCAWLHINVARHEYIVVYSVRAHATEARTIAQTQQGPESLPPLREGRLPGHYAVQARAPFVQMHCPRARNCDSSKRERA